MSWPIIDFDSHAQWFYKLFQDRLRYFSIRELVACGYVVDFPWLTLVKRVSYRAAKVFNIDPVANLPSSPVQRYRHISEGSDNGLRDEFLRILVRAEIVCATKNYYRDLVGRVPCLRDHVRCCFCC